MWRNSEPVIFGINCSRDRKGVGGPRINKLNKLQTALTTLKLQRDVSSQIFPFLVDLSIHEFRLPGLMQLLDEQTNIFINGTLKLMLQ